MEANRNASFFLCLLFTYCHHCTVSQPDCPDYGGNFYKTNLARDDQLEISCDSGMRLIMLASCHCSYLRNGGCEKDWLLSGLKVEDRRWGWECEGDVSFSDHDKESLEPIEIDSIGTRRDCPGNTAVIKIWSTDYHKRHGDRNFNIQCGKLINHTILDGTNCRSLRKTRYEKKWQINITEGYVLTGMWTEHSNTFEDRKFEFFECQFCQTPLWTDWGEYSTCARCDSGAKEFKATRYRSCLYDPAKVSLSSERCGTCTGTAEEQKMCTCIQSAPTTQNVREQEDLKYAENITLSETGVEEVEKEVTDQEEEVVTEALDLNVTDTKTESPPISAVNDTVGRKEVLNDNASVVNSSLAKVQNADGSNNDNLFEIGGFKVSAVALVGTLLAISVCAALVVASYCYFTGRWKPQGDEKDGDEASNEEETVGGKMRTNAVRASRLQSVAESRSFRRTSDIDSRNTPRRSLKQRATELLATTSTKDTFV